MPVWDSPIVMILDSGGVDVLRMLALEAHNPGAKFRKGRFSCGDGGDTPGPRHWSGVFQHVASSAQVDT